MSLHEHLDLLDEITEWLVRAHCAHDVIWNQYYARQAESVAGNGSAGGELPAESLSSYSEEPPLSA